MNHESLSHYNIDPIFFESFLDPYLKYTSGYFKSFDETLEVASRAMLDKIISAAGDIRHHHSILEIGPGWGSLIKRIDERIKTKSIDYYGISPSVVQNKYIQNKFQIIKSIYTTSFESFESNRTFDSIFLIGSFCHLKAKKNQLVKMNSLLNKKGRLIIEDSFFFTQSLLEKHMCHPLTKYVQKEVFGWSEIQALSQFIEDIHESNFKLVEIFENTLSYKKTIDYWLKNLMEVDRYLYPQKENFIKYLSIAQKSWDYTVGNYLITLEKRG